MKLCSYVDLTPVAMKKKSRANAFASALEIFSVAGTEDLCDLF